MKDQLTFFKNAFEKTKHRDISLENYIGFVKSGAFQDEVIAGRAAKERGDINACKAIKKKQPCVTGSAVMKDDAEDKTEKNIKSLNGYILIDIDKDVTNDLVSQLRSDRYTRIIHRSFGGDGVCIFVPINTKKDFRDCFYGLAQYYLDNYNITVDNSCSNPNRLRYMSWDADLFENPKAATFTPKAAKKEPKPKDLHFIYTKSDFDNILDQIKDRAIDLCKEDYKRYVQIGIALANKMGEAGRQYFHFICSYGSKYNEKHCDKDYDGFVKRNSGECTIATIYYMCKEFDINLYTEKTKQIINRVKVAKTQGKPTIESVTANMKNVYSIDVDADDILLIKELIDSSIDFSKEANRDKTDIKQLEDFIVQTYEPVYDGIKNTISIRGLSKSIDDRDINDIYLACKNNFDFSVTMGDVLSILNSSATLFYDPILIFFKENTTNTEGLIEQYARCVLPENDYNVWAFRKWIVGAIHNWTCDFYDPQVSPLTFVLTGIEHGTGKTSFFRNLLPESLKKYYIADKIDSKKGDSVYRLCTGLMVFDDEFGGRAVKDVKEYKALSDIDVITMRRPYGKADGTYRRRAILCGTSNELDILKDVTGNRRILPVMVESVKYEEMLRIDTAQLLAEAYNLYREGFDWVIRTEADMRYLKDNTEENEQVIPAEELFFNYFSLTESKSYMYRVILNQGELIEFFAVHTISKISKFDLKDILNKNKIGYKNHKTDKTNQQKKGVLLFCKHDTSEALYKNRVEGNLD